MKNILIVAASCMLLTSLVLFYSCRSIEESGNIRLVSPPFTGIDIDHQSYQVDAGTQTQLKIETGSTITIPANAFVDAHDQAITGNVEVSYREFHHAPEIIVSGISMTYENNGIIENFESAGMFEIGAVQNGTPVFLAEGKNITVDLKSDRIESDFQYYFLDTINKEWVPIVNTPDTRTLVADTSILTDEPVVPQRFKEDAFVFDLDINTSKAPELKEFNGIVWQYAGKDENTDPQKNDWVFQHNWQTVQIDLLDASTATFQLTLQSSNKTFVTKVVPALKEKDYANAQKYYEKKMKEYENALIARQDELKRIEKERMLYRTFEVNQFGIYNCDRFYNNRNAIALNAKIEFDSDVNPDFNKVNLFLICGSNKSVITYYSWMMNNFRFNPDDDNALVAVLPNDKVAVYGYSDFESIDVANIKADKSFVFKMKTLDEKVASVDDFETILNSL